MMEDCTMAKIPFLGEAGSPEELVKLLNEAHKGKARTSRPAVRDSRYILTNTASGRTGEIRAMAADIVEAQNKAFERHGSVLRWLPYGR